MARVPRPPLAACRRAAERLVSNRVGSHGWPVSQGLLAHGPLMTLLQLTMQSAMSAAEAVMHRSTRSGCCRAGGGFRVSVG